MLPIVHRPTEALRAQVSVATMRLSWGCLKPSCALGLGRAWLVCGLLLAPCPDVLRAEGNPTKMLAQSHLGLAAVIHGIVGYTAWPQPSDSLRLCISRSAVDAAEIARQLPVAVKGRTLTLTLVDLDTRLPGGCDILYLDGWSLEAVRSSLRAVADQPVLTLGRGADFCSDGGMFCLDPLRDTTRFEVNLDAVARSGLRVHPQVLRLARPAPRGAS